jgi:hypothetical protein
LEAFNLRGDGHVFGPDKPQFPICGWFEGSVAMKAYRVVPVFTEHTPMLPDPALLFRGTRGKNAMPTDWADKVRAAITNLEIKLAGWSNPAKRSP